MVWTAPMTAALNSTFTAAQYNANVRTNLLETAPAKATTIGGYFVASGTNVITQMVAQTAEVDTSETTTSTAFTDLATVGPTITVTTRGRALVSFSSGMANSNANAACNVSLEVTGSTSIPAAFLYTVSSDGMLANSFVQHGGTFSVPLTPGSNTFRLKYRVSSGTGTFRRRKLVVIPL